MFLKISPQSYTHEPLYNTAHYNHFYGTIVNVCDNIEFVNVFVNVMITDSFGATVFVLLCINC